MVLKGDAVPDGAVPDGLGSGPVASGPVVVDRQVAAAPGPPRF